MRGRRSVIKAASDVILINDKTEFNQQESAVVSLSGGGFAVAWSDSLLSTAGNPLEIPDYVLEFEQIRIRGFDEHGFGEGRARLVTDGSEPRVFFNDVTAATLGNGDIAVAWKVDGDDFQFVQSRALDLFLRAKSYIATTPEGGVFGPLYDPAVAGASGEDYSLTYNSDGFGRIVSVSGSVAQGASSFGYDIVSLVPVSAASGSTTIVVVGYIDENELTPALYLRHSDANGQVTDEITPILTLTNPHEATAARLKDGNIAIATGGTVLIVSDHGNLIVGPTVFAPEHHGPTIITALTDGGFAIAWGNHTQAFTSGGISLGAPIALSDTNDAGFDASITGLTDGDWVVTWTDSSGTGGDASGTSIKGRVFSSETVSVPAGAIDATSGDITLRGSTAKDDFFFDTGSGQMFGKDTIKNFGRGDRIITTTALSDPNNDGKINANSSDRLTLDNAIGADTGSLKIFYESGKALSNLSLIGSNVHDGTTYYVYGGLGDATAGSGLHF
jgi:hypothetical protein